MAEAVHNEFGAILKEWRGMRRVSQLELSCESGLSQRHISFLETGRANPSRAAVLTLSETLGVPLRERNRWLTAAGFAAVYRERQLVDNQLSAYRAALQEILDHHEPFPAMVLDGRWNMTMANAGALKFFANFIDPVQMLHNIGDPEDFQVVRLCLHEKGLKPYINNWHQLMEMYLARIRAALADNPRDTSLQALADEITHHRQAPTDWRSSTWHTDQAPAMHLEMTKDGETYRLFTVMAHFGAPADVALSELSVEIFYPADAFTRAKLEN